MKHEIWIKDNKLMVVGVVENCEWRKRFDGECYWISGMTLYSLINDGWVKLK